MVNCQQYRYMWNYVNKIFNSIRYFSSIRLNFCWVFLVWLHFLCRFGYFLPNHMNYFIKIFICYPMLLYVLEIWWNFVLHTHITTFHKILNVNDLWVCFLCIDFRRLSSSICCAQKRCFRQLSQQPKWVEKKSNVVTMKSIEFCRRLFFFISFYPFFLLAHNFICSMTVDDDGFKLNTIATEFWHFLLSLKPFDSSS